MYALTKQIRDSLENGPSNIKVGSLAAQVLKEMRKGSLKEKCKQQKS